MVLAASKGLGRAAAESLAAEGCTVVICARDADAVAAAGSEIGAVGLACDVSDRESLEQFFDQAIGVLGGVDVLVTNCGGPAPAATDALDDEQWERAFQLVFMSVVRSCRRVVPLMREQKWGRIVNITSGSVREPIPGLASSNALRPAVAGFSKTLALEVAADNVLVHCVMPGAFLTDRGRDLAAARAAQQGVEVEEVVRAMEGRVPVGRLGDPHELGQTVAFLASERCSFSTGALVPVEGGQLRGIA